ncbi:RSP_2648 family PIN domain-containing protein [Amaricoccus solimangrovi]|uniref:PIN domain-containing protein n=1 Tax=Amaricoccus solimangrovi TaxID=2589815 RepID=A0A501WUW0_9RHOB|nr:PIN domain-containing protein [Amaricoccus solimangrovi]TPE53533.1 PIN domain-containing protein [Amaricoccus solimangrovi]
MSAGPPRVLIDANVLFPTILREIVIGVAAAGAFRPLWSARILEEWARATRRLGPEAEPVARAEIALLRADWPGSEVAAPEDLVAAITLPDPDDAHVLAAAIAGGAETLLTSNRADFPNRILARHGVIPRDPDGFLAELAATDAAVPGVLEAVRARTEAISGRPVALRPLLRRAGLFRLARRLG